MQLLSPEFLPQQLRYVNLEKSLLTDSNQNQQNILRQEKFLNSLLNRLNTEETQVLEELEQVRNMITHKDRLLIHMATDVEKLSTMIDPLAPWLNFISDTETMKEKL
nr:uncharacterized protein LOC128685064 [Cherax quadricarinatus]